jgi:hypothetical protein
MVEKYICINERLEKMINTNVLKFTVFILKAAKTK